MSEQPAGPATRQLEPAAADELRAYAAKTRADADRLAAVLEDIATDGLPVLEQCTSWEELREAHLTRLGRQRPAVSTCTYSASTSSVPGMDSATRYE
ncbi:hypothetical protein [Streptomyces cremeus]|uniref:Uncharacterized protein n=1 Tax=Streptomyces cremeus TaxID=66881 RepID=A0ABV5PIQ8_STRCM